jgi:glycosyltransferase involved in cell wall biosynthesis
MTSRAAVYNRFWHSQGGGERHAGMIAQALAARGCDVDLITHTPVDLAELGDHLGLQLGGCRVRLVPDRGDAELAFLSADYDLFVNGSYMSRLSPRARKNAYLCYFPTPFDADMSPMRRLLARAVGGYLAEFRNPIETGLGWFPPEGGRRRQWMWSNGEGRVLLLAGPARTVRFDLGGPGLPEPTLLTIEDPTRGVVAEHVVTDSFVTTSLGLPASERVIELVFRSATFHPGPGDNRELGVALSRLRFAGGWTGPRQALAVRFPWLLQGARDLSFLDSYDTVMANSAFTQGWIRRLWGVDSEVLFPPIHVQGLEPARERDRTVVSVGRFFRPGLGHAKHQLEMVQAFGRAHRDGRLRGWSMHVLGGCEESQLPYLDQVKHAARDLPVTIVPNAPRDKVEQALCRGTVFWSATGLGGDEERTPWASEHFGMTTVEAMAGGCVPVVIDQAGQREIVREGVDGFRWTTLDEMIQHTVRVGSDEELRARLAASAVERAHDFDEQAFARRWDEIAARHELPG